MRWMERFSVGEALSSLVIFLALLSAAPASAQSDEAATPIPDAALFKTMDDDLCAEISSTLGWQQFTLPFRAPIDLYYEGFYVAYEDGWTVDKNRFAPVSHAGHQGADAAALAPYEGYKYTQSLPFGALLMRTADVPMADISDEGTNWSVPAEATSLEFRINDTGLGDNAGEVFVCFYY